MMRAANARQLERSIAAYTMRPAGGEQLRQALEQRPATLRLLPPAEHTTPGRLGRLLCRVGLHRWQHRSGVEQWLQPPRHRTYSRCGRAGCALESWRIVDERSVRSAEQCER